MSLSLFIPVSQALSDESRVRILAALSAGELCVCQITELLGLATSTVSKHLLLLRHAGLIEHRKQGRWVYCRLAGKDAPAMSREALKWALTSLDGDARLLEDARRLKAILKIDPEDLCRRQTGDSKCCSSAPATPAARRSPKGGPKPSARM